MDKNYTTIKKRKSIRHSATDNLYSRIKEALTLEELRNKYLGNSKATA
jgi:hypothetical protein